MLSYAFEDTDCGSSENVFFLELYQKYKRLVLSKAISYATDTSSAHDIAQDTWMKLLGNIQTLRRLEEGALVTYIVFTVKSTALDFKGKTERETLFREQHGGKLIEYSTPSAEEEFMGHAPAGLLASIWSKLSKEDQLILEGRYLQDQTDEELASIIGCKPGSIRMKLTRARRKARKLIEEKNHESTPLGKHKA